MSDIIVILDNIRSTHNVGSILRTCDGFGVTQVLACGLTPYPQSQNDTRLPHIALRASNQIAKTALGAEHNVSVMHFETLEDAISAVRRKKYKVWAIEQNQNSVDISQAKLHSEPVAIVLGNEISGVNENIVFDKYLEIPMQGQKESFNVSVTAGIALYQLTLK
jgi:23S rRNA (guanosine2251-2'-O)-methyltransferase